MSFGSKFHGNDNEHNNKLIRAMAGSVRKDLLETLNLISVGNSELNRVEWMWYINNFFEDDNLKSIFNELVMRMYNQGYDPNKNEAFRMSFLRYIMQEMSRKIGTFSEIIQMGMLDKNRKSSKEDEFLLEFLDV